MTTGTVPIEDLNPDNATEVLGVSYLHGYPEVFLEGHDYPLKGTFTQERVAHINHIKGLMKRGRILQARRELEPLKYLCPMAAELSKVSTLAANILDADMAYRFRFQDLMNECNPYLLRKTPYQETKRVIDLYFTRDNPSVTHKMWPLKLLPFLAPLLVWKVMPLAWNKLRMDEGDRYWVKQRRDYRFGGHGSY